MKKCKLCTQYFCHSCFFLIWHEKGLQHILRKFLQVLTSMFIYTTFCSKCSLYEKTDWIKIFKTVLFECSGKIHIIHQSRLFSSSVSAMRCRSHVNFMKILLATLPENLSYNGILGVPLGVGLLFFCRWLWCFRDLTTFILTSKTSCMAFRKQWKL